MQKKVIVQRTYLTFSIVSSVIFLALILVGFQSYIDISKSYLFVFLVNSFIAIFTISVFLFYKITIGIFDGEGFNDLLWKAFITGLIITSISTTLYIYIVSSNINKEWFTFFLYYLLHTLIILFVCLNFFIFKKMILYQKTKETANLWQIFEVLLYFLIICNFLQIPTNDILFPLTLIPVLVMGLILGLNIRWIAYLSYKLKIKATIYLSSILTFSVIFIFVIYNLNFYNSIGVSISQNIFTISLLFFITIYSLISVLVLLFNLPTSSVFEQKFSEILNLQRISGSSQTGKTEKEVYDILLESCLGTFMAKTAVLEILNKENEVKNIEFRNFDIKKYNEIKVLLRKNNIKLNENYVIIEDVEKLNQTKISQDFGLNSFLILPLLNFGERLGTVYLFSEIKNAFEKEMIDIVLTYINQASTSISNYRLLSQEVENARYKEEREIAKKVKKHLVPVIEIDNQYLELVAISKSADEVGGDFYDFLQLSDYKFAVIIGDVSGKGTTAAFGMAAMKGIFHSLILNFTGTHSFAIQANKALSVCLEKSSFITLSLFLIDTKVNIISHIRAGHCPCYIKRNSNQMIDKIEPKGLGLGILRNDSFGKFIVSEEILFSKNDILFAFTDGIVEAQNEQKKHFGYNNVEQFLNTSNFNSLQSSKVEFENSLLSYCNSNSLDDDYTFMIIKFK